MTSERIKGCVERHTVPVFGSHSSPPLQPPSRHELGPGVPLLKSQSRRPYSECSSVERRGVHLFKGTRTQMRPACQLSGTLKVTVW